MNRPDSDRWKLRFAHFKKALARLSEVVEEEDVEKLKPLEQEGVIQRFEFTFELAWKTLCDYLDDNGVVLTERTPRLVLKTAYATGVLADGQVFIDMLLSRNQIAHTYDFDRFFLLIRDIKNRYYASLKQLGVFFEEKLLDE